MMVLSLETFGGVFELNWYYLLEINKSRNIQIYTQLMCQAIIGV